MNLSEFRGYRDRFALASMLARKAQLETDVQLAADAVNAILDQLAACPAPASGLQYNLSREDFDERMRVINIREKLLSALDEKQREWAAIDCELSNTERAIPVVEARLAAVVEQPAQVTLLDSLMGVFGYKKASGE